ncbi:MAG TPA: adenylosuccinate synthetase, partial [Acidimicrobiales bacterium]
KLDIFDTLDAVKVCVAYDVDGERHEQLPYHQSELFHARPVYEELPGWREDLSDATELHDLPAKAQEYLTFLEEQIGVPIRLVGVGPGRTQFVQRVP